MIQIANRVLTIDFSAAAWVCARVLSTFSAYFKHITCSHSSTVKVRPIPSNIGNVLSLFVFFWISFGHPLPIEM